MNDWKKQVIGGAEFCEICGQTGLIDAHHYVYKSQSAKLRDNVRNGIRICRACHTKAHGAGGREFIEDWMKDNRPSDKKYCDEKLKEERTIKEIK